MTASFRVRERKYHVSLKSYCCQNPATRFKQLILLNTTLKILAHDTGSVGGAYHREEETYADLEPKHEEDNEVQANHQCS